MSKTNDIIVAAILKVMRPFIKILIRNNVPFRAFSDLIKWMYIDVAKEEIAIPNKKLSKSRIATVTGISRTEVLKNLSIPEPGNEDVIFEFNRAARVITGWMRDPFFSDLKTGKPADLAMEEGEPNLTDLIKKYSGGIPIKAIMDELLRINAIEKTGDGKYRLVTYGYTPDTDEISKFPLMASELSELIRTIDHNLSHGKEDNRLQMSVKCDNLPEEVIAKFKLLVNEKGHAILNELDQWLSLYDRDQNKKITGTGRKKAGLGIFYFEDDYGKK